MPVYLSAIGQFLPKAWFIIFYRMSAEDLLYTKILDVKLYIRDSYENFKIYSASDLVKLIERSIHTKRKIPLEIEMLFEIERRITEIRHSIEEERLKNLTNN